MRKIAAAFALALLGTSALAQRPSDPALLIPETAAELDYVPVPAAVTLPAGTTMGATASVAFAAVVTLGVNGEFLSIIETSGASVGEVLNSLKQKAAGIETRLFKGANQLNRFVNIYLNDEDIRFLKNLETPVKEGDEISIVPAIAGGKSPATGN